MAAYLAFIAAHAVWFGALIVSALMGTQLERMIPRRKRRGHARPSTGAKPFTPPPFDAAQQLRCVERARFSARPVMNRGEARLFEVLERACAAEAPGWRVMAQVSLGEILASPDADAFRAINSKRVDLLLVGPDSMPLHAIELQGMRICLLQTRRGKGLPTQGSKTCQLSIPARSSEASTTPLACG